MGVNGKRRMKKDRTLVKGMPSALLLSILIHGGLFLLAGMLVVFTVVKTQEQVFEPPKSADRPKMKLKKPKVQIKKSSRPKARWESRTNCQLRTFEKPTR